MRNEEVSRTLRLPVVILWRNRARGRELARFY